MNNKAIAIGAAILAIGFWLMNTAGGRGITQRVTDNFRPTNSSPCPPKAHGNQNRSTHPVGGYYGKNTEEDWDNAEVWEE